MTDYNIDFKDHKVQFPNRFKQMQVSPGVVDLIPTWLDNPSEVIEAGTPVNAELFDKLRANVTRRSETFAATAGQTVFNLTKAYLVDQGRIDVYISGIKQRSGVDFIETSPTSFTLSEGLDAGTIVEAVYFSASQALSEDLIEQVQAAESATLAANKAAQDASEATTAALTANLNWLEPVDNLSALNALSNPQTGDTRQTKDTGNVYRYDVSAWVLIQTMDPNAINALNTRLTSQLADKATKEQTLTATGFPSIDFHPLANNPVLTRNNVTDRTAQGVADPFIVFDKESGLYHMFFEVITATAEEIGHAYSVDGFNWTYTQVVITEAGQHFAYPFVTQYNGDWYMIPDKGNKVDVYKATNFPLQWTLHRTLINQAGADATIFEWRNHWYMHVKQGENVNLYHTSDWLNGTWTLHPASPIITGTAGSATKGARGAGKAFVKDNVILLPIQGFFSSYGEYTKWYTISKLSTTEIEIQEGPIFQTGDKRTGWNERGMHHLDHVENGDLTLLIADSIGDASTPNNWSICAMTASGGRKQHAQVKTFNDTALTTATWTRPVGLGISGNVLYDSDYLWDGTNRLFTITKAGYYRISYSMTFYSSTELRNLRSRVINPDNNKVYLTAHAVVPSGGTANWYHTLNNSRVVYLNAGDKLALEAFSNVGTPSLLPNDDGIWFALEKVK